MSSLDRRIYIGAYGLIVIVSCRGCLQTDKQYVVRAELPGIKKEDVKVHFDDHVLTITAERKEEKEQDDETKHYSDFMYGKVTRSIRVPQTADAESIDANMSDGVLRITLNKVETPTKTIEIK